MARGCCYVLSNMFLSTGFCTGMGYGWHWNIGFGSKSPIKMVLFPSDMFYYYTSATIEKFLITILLTIQSLFDGMVCIDNINLYSDCEYTVSNGIINILVIMTFVQDIFCNNYNRERTFHFIRIFLFQ